MSLITLSWSNSKTTLKAESIIYILNKQVNLESKSIKDRPLQAANQNEHLEWMKLSKDQGPIF